MDHDERERIKAAFQTSPRDSAVRILLATDAASEGIDLQNHCHCLIHLEIPYNPNVMEQRNGRIDRHGQRHKEVSIWHPVDGGNGEDKVGGHAEDIIRALRKLESMRADMGSVNPVIAPQMAGLIEGSAEELDTRMAEAKIASARKFVKAERQLEERIAKLHERLLETRHDFHLTPRHIEMAVKTGLKLAGKPPLEPIDLVSAPLGTVFKMPALAGTWARCLEGLRHPHTQVTRPITFDHAVANGRDDVVLIHLNHRLVQMCLRLLRAEIWAQDDVKKLHRVTVRSVSEPEFSEIAVVVISRLVITGGNHHRLHEELTYAGGYLREQGYKREEGVKRIEAWLEQAQPSMTNESIFEVLRTRFERSENALLQTVDARSKDRLKYLSNTLKSRRDREIEDITNVLSELEKAIQTELSKDEQPRQFDMFSDDEKTQLKRDLGALRARLDGIPQERQREIQAIEARYADFTDRTFPVAVVFLVPAAMSVGGRL